MAKNNLARRKQQLKGLLSEENFKKSLLDVLPKHLTPERVVKMVLLAASRQPRIFECTDASIIKAAITSGQLGLDCSGTLGQAYLVPYFNGKIKKYEVQFIPGYQGLISLARRSGEIRRIESRIVCENDKFEFEYGFNQNLRHIPNLQNPGPMSCVYAIAEFVDGSKQLEIMTAKQIEGIKNRSKAKNAGPWVTDYGEMARKTVVRRLFKYLPCSTELEVAIEADNQQYDFETQTNISAGIEGTKKQLKKVVESKEVKDETNNDVDSETTTETPVDEIPDNEVTLKYHCVKCEHDFDEPKKSGKAILCPKCLSDDIINNP